MPNFEPSQKNNKLLFIIVAFSVIFLVAIALYFLFFSTPPRIEVILPKNLESVASISKLQFNPSEVVGTDAFRALHNYRGLPSSGEMGRVNPFVPYVR